MCYLQNMDPMEIALAEARRAELAGEVPVGAVLVPNQFRVDAEKCRADAEKCRSIPLEIFRAHNQVEARLDPTAHAEMLCLQEAQRVTGQRYFEDYTLYVTLEPCAMCAQALSYWRVGTIKFGAYDPKSGGTENGARVFNFSHYKPKVYGGIREAECAALLRNFFQAKRKS
jgi:tRNA(adenine34) deaminase